MIRFTIHTVDEFGQETLISKYQDGILVLLYGFSREEVLEALADSVDGKARTRIEKTIGQSLC